MKPVLRFIVDVAVSFGLVIGGMLVAEAIAFGTWAYCLVLWACVLPAFLFIKYALPWTWGAFASMSAITFALAAAVSALCYFGAFSDTVVVILVPGIFLIAWFLEGILRRRRAQAARATDAAEEPRR